MEITCPTCMGVVENFNGPEDIENKTGIGICPRCCEALMYQGEVARKMRTMDWFTLFLHYPAISAELYMKWMDAIGNTEGTKQ
jgi:hypothetical protein